MPQKIAAWIAGSVGTVGLLLAALGLYGLAAFSVAQRTREIALRMALGATRESVLALVLRQSARLALIGGAVGLAMALGVGMVLQSLLIGIRPIDPVRLRHSRDRRLWSCSWRRRGYRPGAPRCSIPCERSGASRTGTCHAVPQGVGGSDDRKTDIDVMENVFGGRPDLTRRRAAFATFSARIFGVGRGSPV